MKNKRDLKLNFLLNEILIFLIAQVGGLWCGFQIYQTVKKVPTLPIQDNPFAGFSFLAGFLIVSVLYFFFIKKIKRKMPFKLFFSFLIFYGSFLVFKSWLPEAWAWIASLAVIWLRYQVRQVYVHDLSLVLSLIGLGTILGIGLTPWQVMTILAVLSVYDFIAVYKTKHMVKMFKGLLEKGVVMAVIIPAKTKDFFAKTETIEAGEKFLFLGTGDLAFPIIFSTAALSRGILSSILIIFGALLGFIFLHFILVIKNDRRPAPALPPIAIGSILGFLISLLF